MKKASAIKEQLQLKRWQLLIWVSLPKNHLSPVTSVRCYLFHDKVQSGDQPSSLHPMSSEFSFFHKFHPYKNDQHFFIQLSSSIYIIYPYKHSLLSGILNPIPHMLGFSLSPFVLCYSETHISHPMVAIFQYILSKDTR